MTRRDIEEKGKGLSHTVTPDEERGAMRYLVAHGATQVNGAWMVVGEGLPRWLGKDPLAAAKSLCPFNSNWREDVSAGIRRDPSTDTWREAI